MVISLLGAESAHAGLDPSCVQRFAKSADGAMTLAELRERCRLDAPDSPAVGEDAEVAPELAGDEPTPPVRQRLAIEREAVDRPFTIMAHKPNYMLVGAYNDRGWNPDLFREASNDPDYANDDVESQFQISLKVPLAIGLFNERMDLYGAYTNRSFWQVYNADYSRPFRETNHEPEIWAQFRNHWTIWGFTNTVNSIGLVHQSNGRGGVLSRSWNRVYANFIFEKGRWALSFKPWIRLGEYDDEDDNPDISDYMGHGEFRAAYRRGAHVFSLMSRNQVESGFDEGALEVGWSFPVFDYPYLKGYIQYFNGYGESLIDYDQRIHRIGVGIAVTDWLD
ncbi:MAG: phospholipase A [Xanthomonadales bacterium]